MILVEILPNLYLGDLESLKYKAQLGIESQINCGRDLMYIGTHTEYVPTIQKNLEQYELVKMFEYLTESIGFINKMILKDKPILVYCNTNQKAATVICAYLIKYGRVDTETAVKMIRSKNKTSFYPNIDYYKSLKMIENDL